MPNPEYQATDKFRRASYVRNRYSISDPTLFRWCKSGKFPKPQYMNGQRIWRDSVIEDAEKNIITEEAGS